MTKTNSKKIGFCLYFLGLLFISNSLFAALKVGDPAPNLILNDANGNPISLHSLKGQVVLVDFWASWCGPCRAANEDIIEVYANYHPKGFEIYSVSLDKKKEPWLKAIRDDKLSWKTHVTDYQEWNSPAALLYQVEALPSTFLVDEHGIIIAVDIEPYDLDIKLKKHIDQKFRLFPLVASNYVYFSEKSSYTLHDATGKELSKGKDHQLNIESLVPGEYFLTAGGHKHPFTKIASVHETPIPELQMMDKTHFQLMHESNFQIYTPNGLLVKHGKAFLVGIEDLPNNDYYLSVDHHVYKITKN